MLRGVWEALNCLFIHATFCMIATGVSPRQTKNEGRVRKNDDFLQSHNWETVVDRQLTH